MNLKDILLPCAKTFGALTLVTGLVYPLAVTGAAQALFPSNANGSLIADEGKVKGSELIGQPFADAKHFWGRPSATGGVPYNGQGSSGSNQGPLNPALKEAVAARVEALKKLDPSNKTPVPADLVTASASGLDPHISPAAARYQVARVARATGLPLPEVATLVEQHVEGRMLGFLGEPVVNVLKLNLALDARVKATRISAGNDAA
ncbi:potassium-transporting ATPase subunit KdpC [Crenobacter cavernae]|uniref:Potassium-transporting ATPase KdpC subunit n=1 Tax=Crenobacter cavernae TaxID=2290923 RepID=A0ABY0FFL6_9NEIS|nr:potassium-transporting ATPase subunit KdpC [Crenobacter cavernae]RXZ45097.1 potassium-transporting ATPase subunit KdpC [Crenobacter cavernae]